jgi:hypothetical protein
MVVSLRAMRIHRLITLLLLLLAPAVRAQEATPSPSPEATEEAALDYGLSATGSIDDATTRVIYSFDGLRGEFISITLRATSGTLDPMLLVISSSGAVLAQRDDSGGGRDITLESLRIPQTERYFVVVGRFGYGLGTTSGGFELTLERIGVSFADGSGLRYGDTVLNQIDDNTPLLYYTFRAERGDIISIRMERTSGDLDTALQLVDSIGQVVAENDELEGSGSLDAAIIGQTIEQDGTYIIIATRYGQVAGRSSGSFVLSLETGAESGLGATLDFAIPAQPDIAYEGEITGERVEQFYRIEGEQYDRVTVEMNRDGGALDAFLRLTDDQGNVLAEDDDGGGGQNAAVRDFVLPYSGVFYAVATRFNGMSGETTGAYTLMVRDAGNAFDGVPAEIQRLGYGTSVTATLDDLVPRLVYAFYGTQGDVITTSVVNAGGDLDPVVGLLDAGQQLLASDDNSGGSLNALIERYTLPYTGVYYLQAGRYEGADRPVTRGGFVLVLAERFD